MESPEILSAGDCNRVAGYEPITIRTDAGGVPAGWILAWSNPLAGGTISLMNAPLTPSPLLTQGTTYWIVAAKGANVNDAYEWHHSNANTYAGGRAILDTGTGWMNPLLPTDFWFVTYGRELETNDCRTRSMQARSSAESA